jgi:hypothetical protein
MLARGASFHTGDDVTLNATAAELLSVPNEAAFAAMRSALHIDVVNSTDPVNAISVSAADKLGRLADNHPQFGLTETATITGVVDDVNPVKGVVGAGGYTNDKLLEIKGEVSADIGQHAVVRVYDNAGVALGVAPPPTLVDGKYVWSFTTQSLGEGAHSLSAKVEYNNNDGDTATGISSATRSLTVDSIADVGDNLAIAATSMTGSTNIVFQDFVRFKVTGNDFGPGTAIADGGTVAVTIKDFAGNEIKTAGYYGNDGYWYTDANTFGPNTVGQFKAYVETTDKAGNVATKETTFAVDTQKDAGSALRIATDGPTDSGQVLYVYDQSVGLKISGNDFGPDATHKDAPASTDAG